MAAKGTQSKIDVGNIILEAFDDAFWNGEGKEIRVNVMENGEPIQVKLALTVAKVAVEPGAADAIPGAKKVAASAPVVNGDGPSFPEPKATETVELTDKEKDAVANLMAELGL